MSSVPGGHQIIRLSLHHSPRLTGATEVGVVNTDGAAAASRETAAGPEATGAAAQGSSPQSRALRGGEAGADGVRGRGAARVGELDDVEHIEQLPWPEISWETQGLAGRQ